MGRKNGNSRGRRFDTRITFKEMCRRAGISPRSRLILMRQMKGKEVSKTE